jgi:hypothetical protein
MSSLANKLKPGDLLYKVIETLNGPDEDYTWEVYSVKIKTISDRLVALARPFPGATGVRFKPNVIGWIYFVTPEEAIQRHVKESRDLIAKADRQIATATRAIEWALAWTENRLKETPCG